MKHKKIDRKYLTLVFFGALVTLVAMSVAYAALASTLTIMGNAEVQASAFDISIEKYKFSDDIIATCPDYGQRCSDNYVMFGNANIISQPVISKTSINNFNLSVQIPGDMVMLGYKVINTGTIPVKLINVIESNYQITSLTNSISDVEWANDNVEFLVELEDINGTNIGTNEILCPGDTWYLSFGVSIFEFVDTIPSSEITISNLGTTFDFVQADQYLCENN